MTVFLPNIHTADIDQLLAKEEVFDNSSLEIFGRCPREYFYRIVEEWVGMRESDPMAFGSSIHAALEAYYSGKSSDEVCKAFIRRAQREGSDLQTYKEDATNAEKISEYSMEFGLELLTKYIEAHPLEKEPFEVLKDANGVPYLEKGFALDTAEGLIVGKIDGIIRYNNKDLRILEHKTTKQVLNDTFFKQFRPNNQISMYVWAVHQLTGEMPKGALINILRVKDYKRGNPEKNDEKLFARLMTDRTAEEIEQRERQINHEIRAIKEAKKIGFDAFYQVAPWSCHSRFGECAFINLCRTNNEKVMRRLAEGMFRKKKWFPYDLQSLPNVVRKQT